MEKEERSVSPEPAPSGSLEQEQEKPSPIPECARTGEHTWKVTGAVRSNEDGTQEFKSKCPECGEVKWEIPG